MSQTDNIIKLLRKRPKMGATNWELSQISLKYSSRIAEARADGVHIQAVRTFLPNGRATNTWKYYLIEDKPWKPAKDAMEFEPAEKSDWFTKKISKIGK